MVSRWRSLLWVEIGSTLFFVSGGYRCDPSRKIITAFRLTYNCSVSIANGTSQSHSKYAQSKGNTMQPTALAHYATPCHLACHGQNRCSCTATPHHLKWGLPFVVFQISYTRQGRATNARSWWTRQLQRSVSILVLGICVRATIEQRLGSRQGYKSAATSSCSGLAKRAVSCPEMRIRVGICRSNSSHETCNLKFPDERDADER